MFPKVDEELAGWAQKASRAEPRLYEQAIKSIAHKRFHCLGGAVFSLWPGIPARCRPGLLRLIVAFQTISDYLDNLCDRMGVLDDATFRRLHSSMLAALDTGVEASGFYGTCPAKDDGGYLGSLVRACRAEVSQLDSYPAVRARAIELVRLYIDLQVHKHTLPLERTRRLAIWYGEHTRMAPEAFWWEFAAASGSTLGIFALFALAAGRRPSTAEVETVLGAYFPYICGLHILLDYFIDQEEDRQNCDLNLVSYYGDASERSERLQGFAEGALVGINHLPHAPFHRTVVLGLLAMYLSDPKAEGTLRHEAEALTGVGGGYARLMTLLCRTLRSSGRM